VHLLTYNLDQHPFPSPAVKTPGPAVPPGLERSAPRYQRLQRGPRLSSVEALSRAVQPAVGHRHHHLAPHHAQHRELRSASGGRRPSLPTASPCPSFRTGVLSRAVVQPASGPASSLMKTLAVMCIADTRVNALFIIYHSHTAERRCPRGHRSRPEQPQLNPTSTAESESCCGSARRTCTGKASRQRSAITG
jgi:hypothetical protein